MIVAVVGEAGIRMVGSRSFIKKEAGRWELSRVKDKVVCLPNSSISYQRYLTRR